MIGKQIIAFDIGTKRIGVAVSDPFNEYAIPIQTIFRGKDYEKDVEEVVRLAEERYVSAIVCGLPVNADGSPSVQTEITERFISAIRAKTKIPVFTEDERFTSVEAHEILREEGVKRDKHKNSVDAIAASYILDAYLSGLRKKERNEVMENEELLEENEDENIVTIVDEDGEETDLYHIGTIEYKEKKYCVFQLAEPQSEEEEDEVAIYELSGEDQLFPIEDETLLEEVYNKFLDEYEKYEEEEV